ncbi:MAG: serine/threonine protein kinase, partial [Ruminococcus sp.]|nr:serine/threonine protein kinase [Ruminococcus sp.]
ITEIETLKSLDHPKLPSIIDVIDDADSFIIVMDYIEGRSLDRILEEEGPQPEEFVREWAIQLCEVLNYLHTRTPPIIYRDMKPSNVMLKPDGDVTIIDFGTAKKYEFEAGVTTGLGTAGYAAPEQYINSGYGRTDARTDIYAFGMTLYSVLTNKDPQKELITNKSVRAVDPSISEGLDTIILKCTQQEPDDRYQSCAELMFDLQNIDTLEKKYRTKAKIKVAAFFLTLALSIGFAVGGFLSDRESKARASDNYTELIKDAEITSDYNKKAELYQQCIEIPNKAGEKEAYLGMISTYRDNDSVLSVDEAAELEGLISTNQQALTENKDNYVEICFELGKLYWYYYDYGNSSNNQITRAKSAVKWFQLVVDNADKDYANMGMAQAYANIGAFYRDITTNITEASDKGKYKPVYDNMLNLINSVAKNKAESEIVRLELIDTVRGAIQQYATNFKLDGVSKEELQKLYDEVESALDGVDVPSESEDVRTQRKKKITELMGDARDAMELAYSTQKDGD